MLKDRATIKRILEDERLLKEQRDLLRKVDLQLAAAGYSLARRRGILICMRRLGLRFRKPFQDISRDELVEYFGNMGELAESTVYFHRSAVKKFYKVIGQADKVSWIKTYRGKASLPIKSTQDLLSRQDVLMLINAAMNPRDKAIVAVLYESAARAGEFVRMRIGDVDFDQYGARISISGKTGQRIIRLVESVPYLKLWINSHPYKDNPDAPLWLSYRKKELSISRLENLLRTLARRAGLKKRVYPHLFRHSRLTELAKHLTEYELKLYAGHSQASKMAQVYVHLSGRDLDSKILEIHGLKKEEREEKTLKPKQCPGCGQLNPSDAVYCYGCGHILDTETALQIQKAEQISEQLLKSLLEDPEVKQLLIQKLMQKSNRLME